MTVDAAEAAPDIPSPERPVHRRRLPFVLIGIASLLALRDLQLVG
jgi:hypothetical protein